MISIFRIPSITVRVLVIRDIIIVVVVGKGGAFIPPIKTSGVDLTQTCPSQEKPLVSPGTGDIGPFVK
jgi:hypothetical protein